MSDAVPRSAPPLRHWLVVDMSVGVAGGYCTKILADGGADVWKVEEPEGDPLRRWTASGTELAPGEDGALFRFLAAGKHSVVVDRSRRHDLEDLHQLLAQADVVVWAPGSSLAECQELRPGALLRTHPHLAVVAISPFGLEGPWHDRPATELTLQAWAGGIFGLGRGDPERAPVQVGGSVGSWLAGAFGAVGAMVAGRRAMDGEHGELVDVSVLEALALCLTYYPVTYLDSLGRPFRGKRSVVTPGVGMAKDGMVAVGVGTGQQWLDFCVLVGHPEWMEDASLFRDRAHLAPVIDQWFGERTVGEIEELARAFRLPHSVIGNGANLPHLDHFEARQSFVEHPGAAFLQPRPPYRTDPDLLRPLGRAPALGADTAAERPRRPPRQPAPDRRHVEAGGAEPGSFELPFRGLRIVDLTAFWAGPLCSHVLAMLGAEVIHVESTTRPDGTRMLGAPMSVETWWERSPIFAAINTDKKSLTVDFHEPRGMEVLRSLIATADVVIENFTPRVLEQVGLDCAALRALREDLVVVRMPGFGLDGPWRDNAAFAYTIEDASGLTWLTGYPDQKPLEPYCIGDPNAAVHALAGLLLALENRRQTGEGACVEAAMVDAAINITAEQVIEHSAYGKLLERTGNRGPGAAPQNIYRSAQQSPREDSDTWVAISVESDDQWDRLVEALGSPHWAVDESLRSMQGRKEHHDVIDQHLGAWCAARSSDEIVSTLWSAGVPVAKVMLPHEQGEVPQLQARGYFEEVEHPVLGRARYSTLPARFSSGPRRLHRRHAPLLGEHNHEILASLGLSDEEIAKLEEDGVIGRVPVQGGA